MADGNDALIDILRKATESEIEARVYQKIRTDIFKAKVIGGIGAGLVVLTVWFYKPIFEFVVNHGGVAFRNQIKESIDDQLKKNVEMNIRYELNRHQAIKEIEIISQHRSEIMILMEHLETGKNELNAKLVEMREARDANVMRTAFAQTTAEKALAESITKVDALVQNQSAIIEKLKTLNAAPTNIAEAKTTAVTPARKATVYFQFAGFNRTEVEGISTALKDRGWSIPGQERTTAAIDTNQIRFNPKDTELAKQLLKDSNEILSPFRITLTVDSNPRVAAGIPEIWLYKR